MRFANCLTSAFCLKSVLFGTSFMEKIIENGKGDVKAHTHTVVEAPSLWEAGDTLGMCGNNAKVRESVAFREALRDMMSWEENNIRANDFRWVCRGVLENKYGGAGNLEERLKTKEGTEEFEHCVRLAKDIKDVEEYTKHPTPYDGFD